MSMMAYLAFNRLLIEGKEPKKKDKEEKDDKEKEESFGSKFKRGFMRAAGMHLAGKVHDRVLGNSGGFLSRMASYAIGDHIGKELGK